MLCLMYEACGFFVGVFLSRNVYTATIEPRLPASISCTSIIINTVLTIQPINVLIIIIIIIVMRVPS